MSSFNYATTKVHMTLPSGKIKTTQCSDQRTDDAILSWAKRKFGAVDVTITRMEK